MERNIKQIINESSNFDPKNLDLIKKQGVVFTGSEICKKIIVELNPKITDTICEPSVGKGSFVFSLLEHFRENGVMTEELVRFTEDNLYCYDIDKNFINEFKDLLREYFKTLNYNNELNIDNIRVEDFLLVNKKFDIIMGNPPYIRIQNLEFDYHDKLKDMGLETIKKGNIDLYYAFVEKSLNLSKKIGFIIPNSFLKNKSGKILRNIVNDRLTKIYDNKMKKVWENISTYTCLLFCGEENTESFEYETVTENRILGKNGSEWFKHESDNLMKSMIKSTYNGMQTSRDVVYKFDRVDDLYAYKGEVKIEKGICMKTYKATTKQYYWFIYPYNSDNSIMEEDFLKEKYPLAYTYLLENKESLEKRDGGNVDYGKWYAYGRKQGMFRNLLENEVQVILPTTFRNDELHYMIDNCLVISGVSVILDEEDLPKFMELIENSDFQDYLENTNKQLPDTDPNRTWLMITPTSLLNY